MMATYSDVSKTMGSRNNKIQGRVREINSSCEKVLGGFPALILDTYTRPVTRERASARRWRINGAYVSGVISIVIIETTPAIIAINPRGQRQPCFSARKPPARGPKMRNNLVSFKCIRAEMAGNGNM